MPTCLLNVFLVFHLVSITIFISQLCCGGHYATSMPRTRWWFCLWGFWERSQQSTPRNGISNRDELLAYGHAPCTRSGTSRSMIALWRKDKEMVSRQCCDDEKPRQPTHVEIQPRNKRHTAGRECGCRDYSSEQMLQCTRL